MSSPARLPIDCYEAAPTADRGAGHAILLYNTAEAAEHVGVPRGEIAQLCKDGKAPRHYLTGDIIDIYFDEESLDELRAQLRPNQSGDDHE